LKDTVDAMLRKSAGGAGAMYLPAWMTDEEQVQEYCAEERTSDGWKPKQGIVRNEGTDLSVQARALAEHKGLLRLNPDNPLPWAVGGLDNINAVPLGKARVDRTAAKPDAPMRINFLQR